MYKRLIKFGFKSGVSKKYRVRSSSTAVVKSIFSKVEGVLSKESSSSIIEECLVNLPTVSVDWTQDIGVIRNGLTDEEDSLHSIQNACVINIHELNAADRDKEKLLEVVDHLEVNVKCTLRLSCSLSPFSICTEIDVNTNSR